MIDDADLPALDGRLRTDPAGRTAVADDYGHVVHRDPTAVLRPGSVDDVARTVRFAEERRILRESSFCRCPALP